MKLSVVLAVGCLVAMVSAESPSLQRAAQGQAAAAVNEAERERRVFAIYSSTSVTRLATTTIAALSTCLSVKTTACTGRKKRSPFNNVEKLAENNEAPTTDLDASLNGEEGDAASQEEKEEEAVRERIESDRDGKKLTIWSTNFTTLTITSTSYFTGTTVTATAYCSVPGLTAGCFGK